MKLPPCCRVGWLMMWSADECRARAQEVEALSRTVAYEKDRARLREQARTWRDQAEAMEARAQLWSEPEAPSAVGLLGWLRRR